MKRPVLKKLSDSEFLANLRPSEPHTADTLAAERTNSSVQVEEVSRHIRGSEHLDRQQKILSILEKHKVFSKAEQANLARPDRYRLGLARAKQLIRLDKQYGWNDEDFEMAMWLVSEMNPLFLTRSMFRQTIREQANDEQAKRWLPRIASWDFIGAYGQSELGHGSNVRSVELQAWYDLETKDFVLNSPTLTSSKWWNGGLGLTANWSIVTAQLMLPSENDPTEYVSHGTHQFMVQIRDMKTFQPLPGIVVGDIGPKYGYESMDNAYCLFNNVQIPYDAFLSKYSQVDKESGRYTPAKDATVIYGSLTHTRTRYAMDSRLTLARAVTIAVRYTAVRRQFGGSQDSKIPETPVLDYPTVQIRILPLLAACYALHYTGLHMAAVFQKARAKADKGDFSGMNELHAVSSGLKARCTEIAANGLETCRRALGGHGYAGYSGMVQLNQDYMSKPTVEGDNWMITQQNARYILKMANAIVSSKSPESSLAEQLQQYHSSRTSTQKISLFGNVDELSEAFERTMAQLAFQIHKSQFIEKIPEKDLLIKRHELSTLQSTATIVRTFVHGCNSSDVPSSLRTLLPDLLRLFAYTSITQQHMFEFQAAPFIDRDELSLISDRVLSLMKRIRPHAVSLIDAFAIPDYLLDSSLGRYDGNVYEDVFHRAHDLNPLNRTVFNSDYRSDQLDAGTKEGRAKLWSPNL